MSIDEVFDLDQSFSKHNQTKILRSVGIDIGSTTSHLIFSRLTLEHIEEKHKFEIVEKEITYTSDIALTPYIDPQTIDVEKLSSIIYSAYEEAGLSPDDVDTGAVIITGTAANKRNAENIINIFAEQLGKFVCATAGPNYEAVLAAHGSGAVEQSERGRMTIMNVDVGGGTSKIAIARKGEIIDRASLYVGARLIVIDDSNRVVQIEDQAKIIAEANGIRIQQGEILSEEDRLKMGVTLARCLYEVMNRGQLSDLTEKLMITQPLSYQGKIDTITFSGGVAEYIYGHTNEIFEDIGKILGEEILKISEDLDIPIYEPAEGIRATVIGASQYTLQVSGNTIFLSKPDLLPIRNIPVVTPKFDSKILSKRAIEERIRKAIKMRDIVDGEETIALAFSRSVISNPSLQLMKKFTLALYAALEKMVQNKKTIVMVFEADIGMGMGRIFIEEVEPNCKLVSIDEITLRDFNYIDIGEEKTDRIFVPVTIKSLVFPSR